MTLRNDLNSVIKHLTSNGYKINNVFDIGANKGRWTGQYTRVLPKATFYMFEANPNQRHPNLATNHKWFNAVLSSPEIDEVEFYAVSGTGDSYYKEQTKAYDNCIPLKLLTTTLDKIVIDNSLPLPQLIKIDTQGSELDILCGASTVIKNVGVVVIETAILPYNEGAPSFDDYINTLSKLDFVPVGIDEIHTSNNLLIQLDIVFLKKNIKDKYYNNNNFFNL